jgi:hypothetical protein
VAADAGDVVTGVLERLAVGVMAVGLAVIVVVTFVTSFHAISDVARERGAVAADPVYLAWAIPLAVDGLIVVASAAAWLESIRGERWHPFPIVLVAVAAGLSVAANVAHAGGDADMLAQLLAAVPPVFLLAAVELGAWLMRRTHHPTPDVDDGHAVFPERVAPVVDGLASVSVAKVRAEPDPVAPVNGKLSGAAADTAAFVEGLVAAGRVDGPDDHRLCQLVQDHFNVGERAAQARLQKVRGHALETNG